MTCAFDDCGRPVTKAGLCNGHYEQRRYGKALTPLRQYGHPKRTLMEAAFHFADAADDDEAAYMRAWKRLYAAAVRVRNKAHRARQSGEHVQRLDSATPEDDQGAGSEA